MKTSFQILLALVFLSSCGPNIQDAQVKSRYDQVMFVHDEVMPKMSPMRGVRKNLQKRLDKSNPSDIKTEKIKTAISNIEKAEEAMMDWMAEFKLPTNKSNEEQLAYLKEEERKVNALRVQIESALTDAALIDNNK